MEDSEAMQTILQLERETMETINNKDVGSLGRIIANNFTYRTPAGVESSKAEFLNGIESLPVEIIAISAKNLNVSVYGQTAVLYRSAVRYRTTQ
jgi:hypothetical protein